VFNKRILRTGLLAVAVTIAFALFVFQAAKWSTSGQSRVTALEQSTTNNGSCRISGNDASNVQTKIIPQLAFGSFDSGRSNYTTIIEIVNISGTAQTIKADFYNNDGSPLNNVKLSVGDSTIKNGALDPTQVDEGGILIISGGGEASRGVLGWGRITGCAGLSVAAFFELRDGPNHVLVSRSAAAAGDGHMSTFVIPRVRDASAGLDVAFAVVNTSETSATLKAEVKDSSGNTVASKDIVMEPRSQRTGFTTDFFAQLGDGNKRIYQYVKFSSTSPSFGAIALAIQGGMQTNFPVDVVQ